MKKRLLVSLFTLASATLIGSVTTTVAWFVSSAHANVDGLDIDFIGNKELLISTKEDGEYKAKLTKEELMNVDEFRPVSSMKSYEWMEEYADYPSFTDTPVGGGENPQTVKAITGFFSQELFLLSQTSVNVTVDSKTTFLEGDDEANGEIAKTLVPKYPEYTYEEIKENLNNVKKSMRISILDSDPDSYRYSILNIHKTKDIMFAGLVDTNNDGYYDYYKKNNKYYETVYGDIKNRDKIVYDEPVGSEPIGSGLRHKEGVYLFNLEKSIANGANIAYEGASDLKTIENDFTISLKGGIPKRIVLSIYAEGWDDQNSNLLMYASFILSLKLKLK